MKQEYDFINTWGTFAEKLPPILFLHGLASSRKTWKSTAPLIATRTGRKAYLLDARNHGDSEWSKEMDYDVLAQDVLDFMDEHGIDKAVFVGHSMGGRTAMNIALKYPEKVDVLIVEDMTPRDVISVSSSVSKLMIAALEDCCKEIPPETDLETAKRMYFQKIVENPRMVNFEKMQNGFDLDMITMKKIGGSFALKVNLEAIYTMVESNALVQNLPEKNLKFHGDSLFLYGSKPYFNLGQDPSVKKLFSRAVVKKVEGASHYMHWDSPDAFVQEVSKFILHRGAPPSKY